MNPKEEESKRKQYIQHLDKLSERLIKLSDRIKYKTMCGLQIIHRDDESLNPNMDSFIYDLYILTFLYYCF